MNGERPVTLQAPTPRPPARLPDWRCHTCGALLARLRLQSGIVEIKCRNCNTINVREAA